MVITGFYPFLEVSLRSVYFNDVFCEPLVTEFWRVVIFVGGLMGGAWGRLLGCWNVLQLDRSWRYAEGCSAARKESVFWESCFLMDTDSLLIDEYMAHCVFFNYISTRQLAKTEITLLLKIGSFISHGEWFWSHCLFLWCLNWVDITTISKGWMVRTQLVLTLDFICSILWIH